MKFKKLSLITASLFIVSTSVHSANLLVNGNFEDGSTQPFANQNGTYTGVNGWLLTVDGTPVVVGTSTEFDDFGGVGNDQNNIGARNFIYSANAAIWATASGSRPTVVAAESYMVSFSARRDSGSATGATMFIDWFDSTSGLIGSSADLGTGIAGTSLASGDPFGQFSGTVIAPANAAFAGVRFTPNPGSGAVADNFAFDVIPEPSSVLLTGLGLFALVAKRRRI